mgnify:FL=1
MPTGPAPSEVACPCGSAAVIVGGEKLYPHRPDLFEKKFFLCDCGRYVGSHATGHPLGVPADAPTRAARGRAHAAFDPLWKDKHFETRGSAYRWLSAKLGVEGEVHIANMNAEEADNIASLCTEYLKSLDVPPS